MNGASGGNLQNDSCRWVFIQNDSCRWVFMSNGPLKAQLSTLALSP